MKPLPDNMMHKGDEIGADYLNSVAARANLATSIVGMNGIGVRVENGRVIISGEKGLTQPREPGMIVEVVNTGATDLKAYSPAGLNSNYYTTRPRNISSRILTVEAPLAKHAGNFVITLQPIAAYATGLAWFSGMAVVRLKRQFDTVLLNRADTIAGEDSLRASVNGPVQIIWEETVDSEGEDLELEVEHFALVHWDGRGDTYMDWINLLEDQAVEHGCPITSGGGTGLHEGYLKMVRPSADGDPNAIINVGGTVDQDEYGRALIGNGPFLVRLDTTGSAKETCGIASASPETFTVGSIFWRIIAYLGTNVAEETWGIIQRDSYPSLLKATADPSGDTIACQASTEDQGLSGIALTLPVAWEGA